MQVYDDPGLKVEVNVDISDIGNSLSQVLNDAIRFTIKAESGHVIQFKCRTLKWLDGPEKGSYDSGIPGYSASPTDLQWSVDVVQGQTVSPYYDDGGACKRGGGVTVIADQPGVDQTMNFHFQTEQAYPTKDLFCAASIIIANNRVTHVVAWTRTGTEENTYYRTVVRTLTFLSLPWRTILIRDGFTVPALA
ncbi:hypothetical protein C1X59_17055 [Pseudomonas sp. FW215-R2]|uniref:hypothetical protein n=1 Tax=unclassified Pseudomonas TaxID=196821 RepID=UPI000C880C55|nr:MULTISPECIES: hypothetical protein [unclassified Pseudomonas]PMW99532.1 hypothetical protein C1X59_17055 [Pseudomonas sp. FW215-R2]PMX06059.1 hypothetical protein C1X60_25525 [Pseudomonas sp. FW215-L1]PMX19443.1 hypothetical protein C1X57_24570 [Pseudomonas sp. FW215-E1]PNA24775.1 hypothetical protein C1X58_23575 [Pseudomonas sp. FW215-R4]